MKKKQPIRINSQEELDKTINKVKNGYPLECFIQLNYGVRSSKLISLNANNDYEIYHECDDTEETLPHGSLMNTNIGEAITKGALYKF